MTLVHSPQDEAHPHREADGAVAAGHTPWSDLSPFTQGYIEALFAAHSISRYRSDIDRTFSHGAFTMLAPETLARIIADCERCEKGYRALGIQTVEVFAGFNVWTLQQAGSLVEQGYPPLTVQLGDDGKVRFAKATPPVPSVSPMRDSAEEG